MESAVIVIMVLVSFNFILKTSFLRIRETMTLAIISLLLVAFSWPLAIEQSRTLIADLLNNQQLMFDTAILLSIDIALQLLFCFSMVGVMAGEVMSAKQKLVHIVLALFPGFAVFMVMFSLLVWTIFALPGCDFQLVAWGLSAFVAVAIPLLSYAAKWLLPEQDVRLEMLFMGNIATAILCIVATVNGRTAVAGNNSVDWQSLLFVGAVILSGAFIGFIIRFIKQQRQKD